MSTFDTYRTGSDIRCTPAPAYHHPQSHSPVPPPSPSPLSIYIPPHLSPAAPNLYQYSPAPLTAPICHPPYYPPPPPHYSSLYPIPLHLAPNHPHQSLSYGSHHQSTLFPFRQGPGPGLSPFNNVPLNNFKGTIIH